MLLLSLVIGYLIIFAVAVAFNNIKVKHIVRHKRFILDVAIAVLVILTIVQAVLANPVDEFYEFYYVLTIVSLMIFICSMVWHEGKRFDIHEFRPDKVLDLKKGEYEFKYDCDPYLIERIVGNEPISNCNKCIYDNNLLVAFGTYPTENCKLYLKKLADKYYQVIDFDENKKEDSKIGDRINTYDDYIFFSVMLVTGFSILNNGFEIEVLKQNFETWFGMAVAVLLFGGLRKLFLNGNKFIRIASNVFYYLILLEFVIAIFF